MKDGAGRDWFLSFTERHPTLCIREAENLSVPARTTGMNSYDVNKYTFHRRGKQWQTRL